MRGLVVIYNCYLISGLLISSENEEPEIKMSLLEREEESYLDSHNLVPAAFNI